MLIFENEPSVVHADPHAAVEPRRNVSSYQNFFRYPRALYRRHQYYSGYRQQRRHPLALTLDYSLHHDVLRTVAAQGYAVIPNVIPRRVIESLRVELAAAIDASQLCPVDRNTEPGALPATLTERELAMGERVIGRLANIAYVKDPLINCPSAFHVVFCDLIREIASTFYGCVPLVTAVHLMKSFVNRLPETGFNLFHCDLQSRRFLKFFVYLNDVDEHGGPFTIVPSRRYRKPLNWRLTNQWTADEIEARYGKGAIHPIVAKAGDLIIADTTNIHCGRKPTRTARHAIMVNTGVHAIKSFAGHRLRMTQEQRQSLTSAQYAMAALYQPPHSTSRMSPSIEMATRLPVTNDG